MNSTTLLSIKGDTFTVRTLSGKSRTFSVDDIFTIDETDLTKEFIQQPTLYGFFATAMAAAEDQMNRAEYMKEQEYAAADDAARRTMDLNGQKYTETVIRNMAQMDEQYAEIVEKELQAKYDYKILKSIVNALEQRANMLISVGSHLRHEANMTGMNIRENAALDISTDVKNAIKSRREK